MLLAAQDMKCIIYRVENESTRLLFFNLLVKTLVLLGSEKKPGGFSDLNIMYRVLLLFRQKQFLNLRYLRFNPMQMALHIINFKFSLVIDREVNQ